MAHHGTKASGVDRSSKLVPTVASTSDCTCPARVVYLDLAIIWNICMTTISQLDGKFPHIVVPRAARVLGVSKFPLGVQVLATVSIDYQNWSHSLDNQCCLNCTVRIYRTGILRHIVSASRAW